MKFNFWNLLLSVASMCLIPLQGQAVQTDLLIECMVKNDKLVIERINSQVSYVHFSENRIVGRGGVTEAFEGFEDRLLNAYVWSFQNKNKFVFGAAVPGLKSPIPGQYKGLSDFIVVSGHKVMEATTSTCTINIK